MKTKNNFPKFTTIKPENIEAELSVLLKDNLSFITERLAEGEPFNWDNFMQPQEEREDKLNQFWSRIHHLNSVINSPALRKSHQACLPKLSEYATALSHNQTYYQAVKSMVDSPDYEALNTAQKKVIEHQLRDFKLAGVALPTKQKQKFAELSKKLSQLTSKFEENILDATQAWTKCFDDKKLLAGFPEHAMPAAAEAAEKRK